MAQHIPIEQFKQKAMISIANSIRKQRYFGGSLKYEKLPQDYNETPEDEVYITRRTVPKSIVWFKPTIEIHTKPISNNPIDRNRREVTNIYVVA